MFDVLEKTNRPTVYRYLSHLTGSITDLFLLHLTAPALTMIVCLQSVGGNVLTLFWLVVWCSGNIVSHINEVTVH